MARLFLYPRSTFVTTERLLHKAGTLLQDAAIRPALGCGSRANFAEFNRALLPLEQVDLAGYAINPQVHAFDNASLIETLTAQAVSAVNAQALVHSRPLSIGPVTLKPRFNAAATTASTEEVQQDVLPATVDARQMSLFAAGWTLGSIRNLASAGVSWLTYYETTGWRGLMERVEGAEPVFPFSQLAGAVFPLYHVFADLAEFTNAQVLKLEIRADGTLEALAVRQDERFLLLLANVTDTAQSITVETPALDLPRIRTLDESTARLALFASEIFRRDTWQRVEYTRRTLQLELQPYAFIRLDATIKDG